ncbi:MAG: hypothetical protein OSA89_04250 [Mariniblastus sp.]|nr:hypothetical protein [Mariniblastus sp.]
MRRSSILGKLGCLYGRGSYKIGSRKKSSEQWQQLDGCPPKTPKNRLGYRSGAGAMTVVDQTARETRCLVRLSTTASRSTPIVVSHFFCKQKTLLREI